MNPARGIFLRGKCKNTQLSTLWHNLPGRTFHFLTFVNYQVPKRMMTCHRNDTKLVRNLNDSVFLLVACPVNNTNIAEMIKYSDDFVVVCGLQKCSYGNQIPCQLTFMSPSLGLRQTFCLLMDFCTWLVILKTNFCQMLSRCRGTIEEGQTDFCVHLASDMAY